VTLRFQALVSLLALATACGASKAASSAGQSGAALGQGSGTPSAAGASSTAGSAPSGVAGTSGGPSSGATSGTPATSSGTASGTATGPTSGAATSGTAGHPVDAGSGAMSGSEATSPEGGMAPVGGGLGAAQFAAGELDPASNGGTLTFEDVGAAGFYHSRRDPATGPCDAVNTAGCCMTKLSIAGDQLTPWDEDLIMTLRGPLNLKQFATYEPAAAAGSWQLVSAWDSRSPSTSQGIAFDQTFTGGVGSVCLVNASTSRVFPCGSGSIPYCTTPDADHYYGWSGPKLFVLLMAMPHQGVIQNAAACGPTTNGWYDAPWIGLSIGELIREGAFSSCNCYANTNPNSGDGCGQFNAFEVVNDDNAYTNLDVFSTNFFGYGGYVGEGPCGPQCNVSKLAANVDLITKSTDTAATMGAIATQGVAPAGGTGPGAALRRPELGYRYFIVLMDVASRTVQIGLVHPQNIPATLAPLLPSLPASVNQTTIDALLALRLPM